MTLYRNLLLLVTCLSTIVTAYPGPGKELVVIDGHETSIAQATAEQMDDQMDASDWAISFLELMISIIQALNEPAFDYWGNVKEEVETMVGSYINEHNMHQVELFQEDLEKLIVRYLEAPVTSTNYPDKNQQAAALSMAIISHDYLVMSGDLRFSLILHFEDMASMHIVVLKDAAETYSTDSQVSQWWSDLDGHLDRYIKYSETVTKELQTWRMDMISCSNETNVCRSNSKNRVCYDFYTVTDGVTGEVSECRQLAGAHDCVNHCQSFRNQRHQEVDQFVAKKVTTVSAVWKKLKTLAESMTSKASPFYDPVRGV